MKIGFLQKLINRLDKVDRDEVQNYLVQLAQENRFYETIFNAIHEGVIVTDIDGRLRYVNEAACTLFGLQQEECIGSLLSERLRGLDWNVLAKAGKIVSQDMEIFYPQNRFLNFYVVPLHQEQPVDEKTETFKAELTGYAVILRDITENMRSTAETIESERLSALTLLAAGVAHEIGNPLNSLNIHLQLMERKLKKLPLDMGRELKNSLHVAKEEIQRLDDIINQFLRAIRPAPLETKPENINLLVQESVSFLEPEILDRNIIVEQDLRADLPLVEVDRNQIKQAFYNIIRNSFQAMKSEGILHIKTDMDDLAISITFTDTGGGISQDNMSKIFEPYYTTKPSGSGLGLLIVQRVIRAHGGEVGLISTEGQGLAVTIRLPTREKRIRMLEAGTQSNS